MAETPPRASTPELDTVVVTGSYIRGTATDAALPVDVISAEDLAKQGSPSTLEILKQLTVSNGVLGDTNQFDARAQGSEGSGTVNLRGFGPERTLVLLNGRRLVNSPSLLAAAVDTNLIPSAAIGRVEILKDGAAATYGSDAIAGVVNFITRENFRGLELDADYKHIADSNGDYGASAAFGSGNDSVNFLLTAGFQHRSELLVRDRSFASRPFEENEQGGWSAAGNPASFVPLGVTAPTAGNPLGAGAVTRDPQCASIGGYAGKSGATPVCYWQFSQFDALTEKQNRYQVYGEFNWNFGTDSKWHTEAFFAGTEVPIYRTSPSYAALQTPTSTATGGVAPVLSGFYTVPVNNPGYVDFIAKNPGLLSPTGVPGIAGALVVAYRPFAIGGNPLFNYGSSQGERHNKAFRVSSGVNGSFFDGFGYDAAVTYMKQENQRDARDTVVNRLELGLRGLGGANCTGSTPGAAANGCYWFNPFSNAIPGNPNTGQVNSQFSSAVANDSGGLQGNSDLNNWLFPKYGLKLTTDLIVVDAVLNGKVGFLSLPGGDVGWAAGVQYRDTTYKVRIDDIANFAITPCVNSIQQGSANIGAAGCSATQLAAPTGALLFLGGVYNADLSQNVKAAFGELSLPILESLQAQIAARYEDYGGQTGSTFDPKLAIRYQPLDALTLRGSVGTTFRGPTSANVDPNTTTTLQNVGGTFRAVRTSGNPSLTPEKATTFNFGVIVKAGGFRSSLDYWNFDFKKAIGVEPIAGIVNTMFLNGTNARCADPTYAALKTRFFFGGATCDGIIPSPSPGSIGLPNVTRLDVRYINGSEVKTSGLDFAAQFDFDAVGGQMGIGVNATYVLKYDVGSIIVEGVEVQARQNMVGFLNYQTSAYPLPKLKGNLFAEYTLGINNIRWQVNYIDHYEDQRTTEFGLNSPTNAGFANTFGKTIPSTTLHSIYYQAKLPTNLSINLSVENVFNKDPSFARLDLDYDPFTGSPLGRTVKLGIQQKF